MFYKCLYFAINLTLRYTGSCTQPKETGNCENKYARWHYSKDDNKCMPFYYTGCDGNKNNFESLEHCVQDCPSKIGNSFSFCHSHSVDYVC
jgi:hypothetical protein